MKFNFIYKILFILTLITFPLNLFKKKFFSNPYINYILSDYLLIKIYLQDIFIFLIFLIFFIELIRKKEIGKRLKIFINFIKNNKLITFLFLILFIKQFFNSRPLISFFYFLTIIKFTFLFLIFNEKKQLFFQKKNLKKIWFLVFNFTFIFLILLSFYQFIFQKSLFPYRVLGEPNLSKNFNITKGNFFGNYRLLPYACSAHPNILASQILILGIILLFSTNSNFYLKKNWQKNTYKFLIISLIFTIIFLTKSLSILISFLLFLLINKIRKKPKINLIPLLLLVGFLACPLFLFSLKSHNNSIIRRNNLQQQAYHLFVKNPVFGVGWSHFTSFSEKYYKSREVLFFNQPVHNVFWLFLSENGLFGIIILLLVYWKLKKTKKYQTTLQNLEKNLLILLPILCLDHHFFTINSSIFSLFLIWFFIKNNPSLKKAGIKKNELVIKY
jgi:hypothetical protein